MSAMVFDKSFAHLTSDYFKVNPTYEAAKFAKRFQMPQSVFNVYILLFQLDLSL
jgi:hypothetical protein